MSAPGWAGAASARRARVRRTDARCTRPQAGPASGGTARIRSRAVCRWPPSCFRVASSCGQSPGHAPARVMLARGRGGRLGDGGGPDQVRQGGRIPGAGGRGAAAPRRRPGRAARAARALRAGGAGAQPLACDEAHRGAKRADGLSPGNPTMGRALLRTRPATATPQRASARPALRGRSHRWRPRRTRTRSGRASRRPPSAPSAAFSPRRRTCAAWRWCSARCAAVSPLR